MFFKSVVKKKYNHGKGSRNQIQVGHVCLVAIISLDCKQEQMMKRYSHSENSQSLHPQRCGTICLKKLILGQTCIEKRFFSSYFFTHGRSGNISLMSAPLSHGGCGGCLFSGTTFYNFFYLRSRGIDQHNSRKKRKKKKKLTE